MFLTIFLVKKVSLKRADDADKKAEAKAWVEEKKLKKAEKKSGHGEGRSSPHQEVVESSNVDHGQIGGRQ